MFQPLNLFKSINCPFYIQSNNTITCERPYCQFRHPKLSSPVPETSPSPENVPETSHVQEASSNPSENLNDKNKKVCMEELPNILENLSNALQSVQKLFGTSNIADVVKLTSQSTATHTDSNASTKQDSKKIKTSLETISNAISSLSSAKVSHSNNTNENSNKIKDSSKSPTQNSLKLQQMKAPPYNPTPIKELKKRVDTNKNETCDDEDTHLVAAKKRKKDLKETEEIQETFPPELTVKNMTGTLSESANKSEPTKITPKTDMIAFSKLTLAQQVQKRYEMLNKTPPTPMSLAEIRLKKIQQSLGNGSTVKSQSGDSKKSSTAGPQKVPKLIIDNTNKIPLVMRQRYLTVIFENGRGTFATLDKACEKAAEQEKSIYDRAKTKTIYTNLAANLIRSLRNAHQSASTQDKSKGAILPSKNGSPLIQTHSHEAMLGGANAARCTYSINRTKQLTISELSIHEVYKMFMFYVMSEKQLSEHSFPIWMSNESNIKSKKLAMLPNFQPVKMNLNLDDSSRKKDSSSIKSESQLIKQCKRCNKTFKLMAGNLSYLASNSECVHHWGKLRNVRVDKSIVQKYFCCNGGSNETGCEVSKHVYDGEYDGNGIGKNLTGYIEAGPSTSSKKNTSNNIFALDCEMCYTTRGLEVTRVSVVDLDLKEIYESLVKPDTQILDYNTRWSGLNEQILSQCDKNLAQVQTELLKIFNEDTILVGHSLDSDFKALKLVHKKVVDTSVVFPHKLGLPYKRALRNLMSEHLQKIIQEDVQGHDSKEDANSCVQLMKWKINEDLKSAKKVASMLNPSKTSGNLNETSNIGTTKIKKPD